MPNKKEFDRTIRAYLARYGGEIVERLGLAVPSEQVEEHGAAISEKVAKRYSPTHIAVIDDVFTTGATSHACYRALRALFGTEVRISVLTLGYVTSS